MTNFSCAGVSLRPSHAPLLDSGLYESDPRYEQYELVMETDFLVEAYGSEQDRDAALGPVNRQIEFVPVSAEVLETSEYPTHRLAIGPALGERDFERVATIVLDAIFDDWLDWSENDSDPIEVIVARKRYVLTLGDEGQRPNAAIIPMYGSPLTEREHNTAAWLMSYFGGKRTDDDQCGVLPKYTSPDFQ